MPIPTSVNDYAYEQEYNDSFSSVDEILSGYQLYRNIDNNDVDTFCYPIPSSGRSIDLTVAATKSGIRLRLCDKDKNRLYTNSNAE